MSKSNIILSGKSIWCQDEPFAFWLRVMALNLENTPCDDFAWLGEVADDWMTTTRLLGLSNVMGAHLDEDFATFEKAWALHDTAVKVRELLRQLDDCFRDAIG
jgi:hypothetical protein